MKEFVLTPAAETDLEDVWQYIAKDSVRYADQVEEAIFKTCRLAATLPALGRKRPEVSRRNILFLTVAPYDNYLIAYEPGTDPLSIVAVIHGARNLARLFRL